MPSTVVESNRAKVENQIPRATLIFRDVPSGTTEVDVRALLTSVLHSDDIQFIRFDLNGVVFAQLSSELSATQAAQALRGQILGGSSVRVSVKAQQSRPQSYPKEDALDDDEGWTAVGAKDTRKVTSAGPRSDTRTGKEPRPSPSKSAAPISNSSAVKKSVKESRSKAQNPSINDGTKAGELNTTESKRTELKTKVVTEVKVKSEAFPSLDDLLAGPSTKKALKLEVARRVSDEAKQAPSQEKQLKNDQERKIRPSGKRVHPASIPLPPSVKLSPAPPASFLLPADGYKVRSYSLDKIRSIASAVLATSPDAPKGVQAARSDQVDVVTASGEVRAPFIPGPEPASKWPHVLESPLNGPRRSARGSRTSEGDSYRRSPGLAPLKV